MSIERAARNTAGSFPRFVQETVTDGSTECFDLVAFSAFSLLAYKPLDRASVERLVGRRV